MKQHLTKHYYKFGAAFTAGMLTSSNAHAGGGNDFNQIANNIIDSIADMPSFLTGISYMVGLMLGVLGVMKIKDHVENPSKTPIKDGAIRLAAGGALFALPIVMEAMQTTVGDGAGVEITPMGAIEFQGGG